MTSFLSLVIFEGQECQNLKIILSGSVNGVMINNYGNILKIENIFPSRPLAPEFLFGNNCYYPVNILSNEPTEIIVFPKYTFVKLIQENENVLSNFLNIISDRAQFLSDKIKFLQFRTIKDKLLYYIYNLSAGRMQNTVLPLNQY